MSFGFIRKQLRARPIQRDSTVLRARISGQGQVGGEHEHMRGGERAVGRVLLLDAHEGQGGGSGSSEHRQQAGQQNHFEHGPSNLSIERYGVSRGGQ